MDAKFAFGKNWKNFLHHAFDQDRYAIARESLGKYLPPEEYQEKIFIDIGCGSGIFSLSALDMGVKQVISLDVDADSVEATRYVKEHFCPEANKAKWDILTGDILDQQIADQFKERGDIVYSWGVLHHTGDMDQAIRNAAKFVRPNGYFIIAIYNRAPSSEFWLKMKEIYNSSHFMVRKLMVFSLFAYVMFRKIVAKIFHPTRPLTSRGMSIYYDVVDWIGGYPYEYATFDEMRQFVEGLGFRLIKAPTILPSQPRRWLDRFSTYGTGNNEYVFIKHASP